MPHGHTSVTLTGEVTVFLPSGKFVPHLYGHLNALDTNPVVQEPVKTAAAKALRQRKEVRVGRIPSRR